jgi:putative PIN family toxin of toxin-antitoxin system
VRGRRSGVLGRIIVDANVLVSAAIRETGAPRRVIDAALGGVFAFLISGALVGEYQRVFRRPNIVRAHRLDHETAARLIAEVEQFGTVLAPDPSPLSAPDPGDQHLWDLLAAVSDAILVTGDRLLLESRDFPGRVLSPRQFVEMYLTDRD